MSFLACSVSFADTAAILNCYNEIHAPSAPAHVLGVPVRESELDLGHRYSRYKEALSTTAYIVTSKTILKQTFNYETAENKGTEPNPDGGGEVQISVSPVYEVDPLYSGVPTRVFVRAKWSSTLDHPNGASLSVVEEFRDKAKPDKKSAKNEQKIDQPCSAPEVRAQVLEYLKGQIGSAVLIKPGSSRAYDVCHSIPELTIFMESKMNSFKTDPNSMQPGQMGPASSNIVY